MRLRIILFFTITFLSFTFYFSEKSYSQATCCVGHGGEYACDYTNGTLYCRDGTISTDCTCKILVSPTPKNTPTPVKKATPTLPKCPANSTYNRSSNLCECVDGFTVFENSCISYDAFCRNSFGRNAVYKSDKNACVCAPGYSWNSDGKSCVTSNKLCQEKLGEKSYYNSGDNSCYCFQGYSIQNNECRLIPTNAPTQIQETKKVLPTPTTKPEPTIAKKIINSPTPGVRAATESSTLIVNDDGNINFVADKKESKNMVSRIIHMIWDFFLELF